MKKNIHKTSFNVLWRTSTRRNPLTEPTISVTLTDIISGQSGKTSAKIAKKPEEEGFYHTK